MHGHGEAMAWFAGVAVAAAAYLLLALRQAYRGRGFGVLRAASMTAGAGLLLLAFWPGALPWHTGDFRHHMLQHLLIGMLAPLALVMAAPMTLLLQSLPRAGGKLVVRVLHSPPARFLCHPVSALTLNIGGMGVLYFTPLYAASVGQPVLHHWIHAHFLFAGYLFAWVIAGPDPAPMRPSVPNRLVILGIAIFCHSVFSQLLYAGIFVDVPAIEAERQGAAELMYYGGDLAELLLAFAMISSWRPGRRTAGSSGAPAVFARYRQRRAAAA